MSTLLAVAAAVLVQLGALHWHLIHRHEALLLLVLVGPPLLVVATRTWRWRSHKIHVTSERVIVEGGVARRFRTSVELREVVAIRVEQGLRQRISRRGDVYLETSAGTFHVGRVRHPAAFARLVDKERLNYRSDRLPFDTVFEFEDPSRRDFEVNPRRHDERT